MASSATAPGSVNEKKKNGGKLFMIACALMLVAANAGFWFYRTKIQTHDAEVKPVLSASASKESALENVALDPFIVNLVGGEGYLRVTMTLSMRKDGQSNKELADEGAALDIVRSAVVRDTILNALSAQDGAALLTVEGKAALKRKLMTDLEAKVPTLALDNIYFTDFLVQQ